jgi:S-adenosyl methyltransferase
VPSPTPPPRVSGLPTVPSTHETARDIQPDATVAYVDNDEQVLTHAQNILARTEGVLSVAGDLGYPDEILYDWRIRQAVDFCQPVCLVLTMTLHFYDAGTARRIAAQFTGGVPDGSYVIISAGQLEGDAGERFTAEYRAGQLHHHGQDEVASFLDGLELVGPGITEARRWRAPVASLDGGRPGHIWAGAGRKTGTAL